MFDGNPNTDFAVSIQCGDQRIDNSSSLMIDFGEELSMDKITVSTLDEYSLYPHKSLTGSKAYVSNDLLNWKCITFLDGVNSDIYTSSDPVRYMIVENTPIRVSEVNAYKDGKALNRDK